MNFKGNESTRRELTSDGWVYESQENKVLAIQCIAFLGTSLVTLDDFIERMEIENAPFSNDLRKLRERALLACISGDSENLEERLKAIASNLFWVKREEHLLPLANTGASFLSGRKPGTVGPIRKKIKGILKKDKNIKNDELWKLITENPPKGWRLFDNRAGRYAEGPKSDDVIGYKNMSYKRFCNVVSEERRLLKAR